MDEIKGIAQPRCWALARTRERCEGDAGHSGNHFVRSEWDDDHCYDPNDTFPHHPPLPAEGVTAWEPVPDTAAAFQIAGRISDLGGELPVWPTEDEPRSVIPIADPSLSEDEQFAQRAAQEQVEQAEREARYQQYLKDRANTTLTTDAPIPGPQGTNIVQGDAPPPVVFRNCAVCRHPKSRHQGGRCTVVGDPIEGEGCMCQT